jgi:hypothetical protein
MQTVIEYCQQHEPRLRLCGIAEDEIMNLDSRVHSRREAVITLTAITELFENEILRETFIQHRRVLFPGKSWVDRAALLRSNDASSAGTSPN